MSISLLSPQSTATHGTGTQANRPVSFAGMKLVQRNGDQVTFSGLANKAGSSAKKAGLSLWGAVKQLRKLISNSSDGKILQGVTLKYLAPSALSAVLVSNPVGWALYPLLGIPIVNRLSNRGEKMIAAVENSADKTQRSIVHRITNVFDGIFDPMKGEAKAVISDYNSVKDDLLNRMANEPKAAKSVGGKGAIDKLKRFLHLTEGKFGYNLVGKLVNANKVYSTSRIGGLMKSLINLGRKWKVFMPLSIIANGLFVALKWKKIRI